MGKLNLEVIIPIKMPQGTARVYTLTHWEYTLDEDGDIINRARKSLAGATITLTIKDAGGAVKLTKTEADDITILPDTGNTVGQATIQFNAADTITTIDTPGTYTYSVLTIFADGTRESVIDVSPFIVVARGDQVAP